MAREAPPVTHAVPDASLVVKWHTPDESGWDHALTFYQSLEAGAIHLSAPEHLKVEVDLTSLDESRTARHVEEIISSPFFAGLEGKLASLRARRR